MQTHEFQDRGTVFHMPLAAAARRMALDAAFIRALQQRMTWERLAGRTDLEDALRAAFPRLGAIFCDDAEPDGRDQVLADLLESLCEQQAQLFKLAA